MPSTTAATAAAVLLLLSCTLRPLSSTSTVHSRRILHQPLLPLDSTPPSPPPASPPPKLPFTSSSPENPPFFRSYPSPPSPPSPASLATFPANISSLAVPRASKPNSSSSKLIIAAVAAVIAAVAVVSLAAFLHLRRRTSSSSFSESKTVRSDNCSTISFNQTPNTKHIPKLQRPSQSSAEFLYLGTLVNTHAPGGGAAFNGSSTSSNNVNTRKLDSPELRPLPPLIMQRQNFRNNAEAVSSKDDESEEFYSPKGSIKSSFGAGSASRRAFAALEVENFNGSTSNSSSTYSSSVPGSNSASPVRSRSSTLSPANNLSPNNSLPKSPDLIEIQTIATLPAQAVTPLPEMQGSLLHESASPSPPSSSSPEIYSRRSVESSPRISNASDQDAESPVRSNSSIQHKSSEIPAPPEIRGLMLPESTPTLPPSSPSPERCLIRNEESSPRNSNVLDKNVESPVIISRISNASDQDGEAPVRSNSCIQESYTVFPTPLEIRGLVVLESAPPLLPTPPSPDRYLTTKEESSPRNSNVSDQNEESPLRISSSEQHDSTVIPEFASSLLPISPSSDRCLMRSEESSPRNSTASDQSVECPAPENSTITPTAPEILFPAERYSESERSSPRNSNVSDRNVESPVRISSPTQLHTTAIPPSLELQGLVIPEPASLSGLSSPERYTGKNEELSPRVSNASDEDMETPLSSPVQQNTIVIPTLSEMEDLVLSSPRISIASDQAVASPVKISSHELHEPPSPVTSSSLERYSSCEESPVRILSDLDQNVDSPVKNGSSEEHNAAVTPIPSPPPPPVSVPPPPPPPPLPLSQAWNSPRTPTPTANQPIKPPALKNPLKPIAFQTSTLISPIQLPSNDPQTVKNDEDKESPTKETECSSQNADSPPKPKLKPLHWDKVRASSDREMVWDQLKCSSFELNEEMIETLFVVNTSKPNLKETTRWQVLPSPGLDNGDRLLDPKKAQNIAILLKALHVTVDEVCEGLLEGNADVLGTELLESLLKMAPTKEEERKLKEYKDDSPIKLGPAERFLKAVVDIPHAFKRVEAMLFVSNFESEVEYLKKSFSTLEAACEELRTSRVFLKLLEAVLRTGNRMNVGTNRGDAHAFKLDTLLKLVDVKGADGKTTLLHFVVQEMIRSEGARLSGEGPQDKNDDTKCRRLGLQVVSALSSELANVKKAAVMDAEMLSTDVSKLSKGIGNATEIVKLNEDDNNKFSDNMNSFTARAEEEICRIQAQESLALSLVKEITEYFHGNSALEEAHPFRIFMVVRDFLTILDRVCKEVGLINERTIVSSAHKFPVPVNPMLQQVPAPSHIRQCTSSDDESLPLNV